VPYNTSADHIAVYGACPALVARNVAGNFTSPPGVQGGWSVDAPPGTTIAAVTLHGEFRATNGWLVTGYTTGGGTPWPW
jgi:hypothetical protein